MKTHFASPERATPEEINSSIIQIEESPVVSSMLHYMKGIVAIINEHRQIIAVNDSFLEELGIEDPVEVLGLRPGEALHCSHAADEPAGCGTGQYCSTCGAAIAIVATLGQEVPAERMCALSVYKLGQKLDLSLLVSCQPFRIEERKFALIMIQDKTIEQRLTALEKVFFHDVNNLLNSLLQASDLLTRQSTSPLAEHINNVAWRLNREVAIQRSLTENTASGYRPTWSNYSIHKLLAELQRFFANHPASANKDIIFEQGEDDFEFSTDISALFRVLTNMVLNALEATPLEGKIKINVKTDKNTIAFSVWNEGKIKEKIAGRIFQRNFSTKSQIGRGIGTFSMKLLGEEVIGGKVDFTTSEKEGTIFTLAHPLRALSEEC